MKRIRFGSQFKFSLSKYQEAYICIHVLTFQTIASQVCARHTCQKVEFSIGANLHCWTFRPVCQRLMDVGDWWCNGQQYLIDMLLILIKLLTDSEMCQVAVWISRLNTIPYLESIAPWQLGAKFDSPNFRVLDDLCFGNSFWFSAWNILRRSHMWMMTWFW